MADAMVFVDDAVLGRLPPICAKDGVPAPDRLRIVEEIGRSNRLGLLWLLVLAGPIGWIALIVLSLMVPDRGEQLAVEVPYSEGAYRRFVAARRLRSGAFAVALLAGFGLLVLTLWAQLGSGGMLLAFLAASAGVAVAAMGEVRLGRASVGVELDASRRWVTLRDVHPAFAAACHQQLAEQAPTEV